MRKAYLDCSAGISGDMFLAALIDGGVPVDKLFAELKKLSLGFYEFKRTRALRGGIMGTRVDIRVPGEQPHRHLSDIQALLEKASLPEKAFELAMKTFNRLAEVEGKLHNMPADEIHFHEVGAVDAIIDIVGTCVGIGLLDLSEIICSPLNVGSGQVNAAHGTLPVPAPATAELLKDIPVYSSGVQGELVTPTGAALVATLATGFGPLPSMKVSKIGYGAGEKNFSDHPNIARLFVGEAVEPIAPQPGPAGDEVVSLIEATLDEMNSQAYATFVEQAVAAGALDVSSNPGRTKARRPGLAIGILCDSEKTDAVSQFLLDHANASDVRISDVRRKVASREQTEHPKGDEVVSVVEASVEEMNPQAYRAFLDQLRAAGALDINCSTTRLKGDRPGLAFSITCEPDKIDAISQLLFAQSAALGVRFSEARRRVTEREQPAVESPHGGEVISVIEASLREMNPQALANLQEQLRTAGALDVTCNTTRLNKNRMGLAISILCEPDKTEWLSQLLFEQTTATGVRISEARRKASTREQPAEDAHAEDEVVSVIEATVDEMNPQAYAAFLDHARDAGALDVTYSPARMKQNRPGITLNILCEPAKTEALSTLLFEQTNAIGVRVSEARRKVTTRIQPAVEGPTTDEFVAVIEANVDDMSPQIYGYFLEQALAAGALDVTCNSTQMKKNRPGLTISILCDPTQTDALSQLLFEQTTTIGVRIHEARRKVLQREMITVETPLGSIKVKVSSRDGKVVNAAPEFDDCRQIATEKAVPLKHVIAAAEAAYLKQGDKAASA